MRQVALQKFIEGYGDDCIKDYVPNDAAKWWLLRLRVGSSHTDSTLNNPRQECSNIEFSGGPSY